jgi:hypothetical protein
VRTLSAFEIGEFASLDGAQKTDVEDFLCTVGQAGTEEGARLNLFYDARLYSWDILTVMAIEAGIKSAYAEEATDSEAVYDGISTPLPGAPYSLWPYNNR